MNKPTMQIKLTGGSRLDEAAVAAVRGVLSGLTMDIPVEVRLRQGEVHWLCKRLGEHQSRLRPVLVAMGIWEGIVEQRG